MSRSVGTVLHVRRLGCLVPALALTLAIAPAAHGADGFTLSSAAFHDGARIAAAYTCSGADVSPPLAWSGAPATTKSFALVVDDPDAPGGTFVHWVAWDLPAGTASLAEAVKAAAVPGMKEGKNGFGRVGWGGPCPPPGRPHHYGFRLLALDVPALDLGAGATAAEVLGRVKGHVLGEARLTGTFGR